VDDTDGREPKMLLLVPIQIKISEISWRRSLSQESKYAVFYLSMLINDKFSWIERNIK
jgi:hypothetical protein